MHIPVLKEEIIKYLNPKPNENFVDATIGLGGHSKEILKRNGPKGRVLGIEADPELIRQLEHFEQFEQFKHTRRLIVVNDSYVNLKEIIERYNFRRVRGILFDLGMSSWHLEKSGRGFSFQRDEPLVMRYAFTDIKNQKYFLTAEKIVNEWPEKEIEKILKEYGEERFARSIAKKIVEERKRNPIKTTFQLKEVIKKATPPWYQKKRKHFATKTFQALRIAVNDELENLKKALSQAQELLEKEGRILIISFHSLEDRLVKNFFREKAIENQLKVLTKKPITPSLSEIKKNPRCRSAKLRAGVKL